MCGSEFWNAANAFVDAPVTKALGLVAGAWLAYHFGMRSYFIQKQAEAAREKYVTNGVERAVAQLDRALWIYQQNWKLFLRYVKLYRESPIPIDTSDFARQVQDLDSATFEVAPIHRVSNLVGDQILWTGYQLVFSFVGRKCDLIAGDFGPALVDLATRPGDPNKPAFIEEATREARAMAAEANELYPFLSELLNLGSILEGLKLNRKQIHTFKKRPDVQDILRRLRERYPKWVTEEGVEDSINTASRSE